MNSRRDFLKLGALWAPALVAPRVAYSFLRAPVEPVVSASAGEVLIWDGSAARWSAVVAEKLAEFRAMGLIVGDHAGLSLVVK